MKNHIIFLALGANVGDKKANIEKAVRLLREKITDIKQASIYETKPVGFTNQDTFLNTVVMGKTHLSPKELLGYVKDIEKQIGRIERFRWGPREIDIDILFYDDLVFTSDNLELPHPRLHERDFVLKPFLELQPYLMHPHLKKTIKELYEKLPKKDTSVMRVF